MAVQALLPLLLAAEIRLADAGELPTCALSGTEETALPVTHRQNPSPIHHHGGMSTTCPICQTVATGHAFADTAAAPMLSTPQTYQMATAFAQPPQPFQTYYSYSYRARAPPSSV
jgi:hypothetical protein